MDFSSIQDDAFSKVYAIVFPMRHQFNKLIEVAHDLLFFIHIFILLKAILFYKTKFSLYFFTQIVCLAYNKGGVMKIEEIFDGIAKYKEIHILTEALKLHVFNGMKILTLVNFSHQRAGSM